MHLIYLVVINYGLLVFYSTLNELISRLLTVDTTYVSSRQFGMWEFCFFCNKSI